MDVKKKHWQERKVAEEKKPNTVTGQAHIQTGNDEEVPVEEKVHQDLEEEDDLNFAFIQNKSGTDKMVTEQHARERLKPLYIYLDSTLSFHQMFCKKYMTDVSQVDVTLCSKCNGGELHSDEKGCMLDTFHMWLVCTGRTNLLSLPMLEPDGYVCQYHTNSLWIMEYLDGTVLKFKHNNGLCKGFPCIDMDKLKDHIFKPSGVTGNTLKPSPPSDDLGTKPKALKQLPKRKTFAFHTHICDTGSKYQLCETWISTWPPCS